jgi:hypothetical protein
MNYRSLIIQLLGWLCGILFSAIGLVNIFWGNDSLFGLFLLALSLLYYPPVQSIFRKMTGYQIHAALRIALGIFIIWASLGVGELFDKIDLMLQSF